MKKLLLSTLLGVSLLAPSTANCQIDFDAFVSAYDTAGFVTFIPNVVQPGEPWETYLYLSGDTLNDMVLDREMKDSIIFLYHSRYQQTFKGLRIEACYYTEHWEEEENYLVFANGFFTQLDEELSDNPEITESHALTYALESLSEKEFAWDNESWELDLQESTGNEEATYYPEGELFWALDNYQSVPYYIPSERFRLAWAFKILSINPISYKKFFVDAQTGEVFRVDELIKENGPATITYHGTQTIDTRWAGAINHHILHTNDNGRNYHTKKGGGIDLSWGLMDNYNDADDTWGAGDEEGTTVHWFIGESLDFLQEAPYFRNINDEVLEGEIRIKASMGAGTADTWIPANGPPVLSFGPAQNSAIDIVGHEVIHLLASFSQLGLSGEPGALEESFCDIFGELIEDRTESGIDWIHGGDPESLDDVERRSFSDPNSLGFHYDNEDCDIPIEDRIVGQPDTYEGAFWEFSDCDLMGIHINDGPQNFWFYLLCNGGTGVNDNNDSYSVSPISVSDAAQIAYFNLTTLSGAAGYIQARANSSTFAGIMWGFCSAQHEAVINAWHAVGVGDPITCTISIENDLSGSWKPKVFPNPSNNYFSVQMQNGMEVQYYQLVSINGKVICQSSTSVGDFFTIDLSSEPSGIYFLQSLVQGNLFTERLVKQ
jgi:bacillolysin